MRDVVTQRRARFSLCFVTSGYENGFDWDEYNAEKSAHSAPEEMFSDKVTVCHGFRKGMKLEAVDLMEPDLICVATVTRFVVVALF